MKKVGSIFYFIVGLMGVGCWGFNMLRALGRVDMFLVVMFGLLTLLSVILCGWAIKNLKGNEYGTDS